jgi:hypothetical protein
MHVCAVTQLQQWLRCLLMQWYVQNAVICNMHGNMSAALGAAVRRWQLSHALATLSCRRFDAAHLQRSSIISNAQARARADILD